MSSHDHPAWTTIVVSGGACIVSLIAFWGLVATGVDKAVVVYPVAGLVGLSFLAL